MINGFDVYKIYQAVRLHFTSDSYDYFRYNGEVNIKLETFTRRKDRYFFHKLGTKYSRHDDILDYFVCNFLSDSKKWIGNLLKTDGHEVYNNYRKIKESFDYHFRNDCVLVSDYINARGISFDDTFSCPKGQHPRFLQLLLSKKISYPTATVFNYFLQYRKKWDNEIDEKFVWPVISKRLQKFEPFFRFNKTKAKFIMKEIFV